MVKAVFDELPKAKPRNHFTVGIVDDVTHRSLRVRHRRSTSSPRTWCARCSSASAPTAPSAPTRTRSRSSARRPTFFAQGYFVYDSKKSGAITISHLRFGPRPDPLDVPHQQRRASWPATSSTSSTSYDVLVARRPGRTFLLNSPTPRAGLGRAPREVQEQAIIDKKLRSRDRRLQGRRREAGIGRPHQHRDADLLLRLSGVLPREEAIAKIKPPSRRPTASAARRSSEELAAVDARSRTCTRSPSRRGDRPPLARAAPCPAEARPTSCSA
jgi:pyruvate-ferredoxin/flavodoxin oxidoreductase